MNIFYVHHNPKIAAQSLIDVHVNKMIVETGQLLANCYTKTELMSAPLTQTGNIRGYSHINHPCTKWVKTSLDNFLWLVEHGLALCEEKIYRTEKPHFSFAFINWCSDNWPDIPDVGFTRPALAFNKYPELQDYLEPVLSYRNYYNVDKRVDKNGKKIDIYTKRERPSWFPHESYL